MRKFLAAASVAVVLGGLAPAASALSTPAVTPRLSTGLSASLAKLPGTTKLMVFVHGSTRDSAVAAIKAAKLTEVSEFTSVGVPVAIGTVSQIKTLAKTPGLTYIEQDEQVRLLDETSGKDIRAEEAEAQTYTGSDGTTLGTFDGAGQTIAIVDGGVDGTHPMFTYPDGTSKVVRNFKIACFDHTPGLSIGGITGGVEPATCPADYTGYGNGGGSANDPLVIDATAVNDTDTISAGGHGTHVAGIAAGLPVTTTDGRHLQGIAPGAKLVALSMGLSLTIYGEDAGLDWVERHHADPCGDGSCPPITAVNNSYGGGGDWDPQSVTSLIQAKLIDDGVTPVWANGNGDVTNDGGDGSTNLSGRDAANQTPGVISVANYDDGGVVTRDGALDPSSSRGLASDYKTWPDVSAPGANITSACRPYLSICNSEDTDLNYGTISGTSMAAPHVTGVVAVLQAAAIAKNGQPMTPAEMEDLLEDTAHKFTFGADYEPVPNNPDNTSSFDKGHGLVDVTNAMNAIFGVAPTEPAGGTGGGGSTSCVAGAPLVTDPSGDATTYAVADTGTNEPNLDVTSVTVSGDPTAETMSVVFHVADLTAAGPSMSSGMSFEGTIAIGNDSYDVGASRDTTGDSFTLGSDDVTGSFDIAADTVTVVIPRSLLGDRSGSITVKSLTAGFTRYRYPTPVFGPAADSFEGTCPQTVDVGGAPAGPDGTAVAGSPYTWTGTSTGENAVGDPAPGVSADGDLSSSKKVDVTVAEGGTVTFTLSCDSPVDDWDISLTGPDGKAIGTGTAPGTSANSGCDEKIVVTNAPSGVYTATVDTWAAANGTYTGTMTVS